MSTSLASKALEQGKGIIRLTPTWVPRSFCVPGRRIKLHPDDYYALGGQRGGIDERWFASTTPADHPANPLRTPLNTPPSATQAPGLVPWQIPPDNAPDNSPDF